MSLTDHIKKMKINYDSSDYKEKNIYNTHFFFLNDRQTVETKHTGQFPAMEKRIVS